MVVVTVIGTTWRGRSKSLIRLAVLIVWPKAQNAARQKSAPSVALLSLNVVL